VGENPRPLTGLSHGAAGIGAALLELFQATRASEFREAAEAAFAWERRWFDEDAANWPDFRGVAVNAKPIRHPSSFPVAWCHGSAGIALSRLRAYGILGSEAYRREAVTALRTTVRGTVAALRAGPGNFGLCHGVAGNAAVVLQGFRTLPAELSGGKPLAMEAAAAGLKYGRPGAPWPFGELGGDAPGLMLGLAGVGHFYLALGDAALPSLLMLEPEAVWRRLGRHTRGRREAC